MAQDPKYFASALMRAKSFQSSPSSPFTLYVTLMAVAQGPFPGPLICREHKGEKPTGEKGVQEPPTGITSHDISRYFGTSGMSV